MSDTAPSVAYTRYVLCMIFLLMVFNACDRTIVSVLAEDIKADFQLTDREMGTLLGIAFALVHFIATIPLARLADRWSRPRVMAAGLFAWSIMTAVCGMAQNFWQLALARMGVGLGEAAGGASSQALITEYVPIESRGRAMSLLSIGGVTGLGLGVIYGGWASQAYSWRFALVSVGIPGALLAILFWYTVADRRAAANAAQGVESLGQVFRQLFANRAYVLLICAVSLLTISIYGRILWDPTFLRRIYGMSPVEAGTWYFVIGPIPSLAGALFGGYVVDVLARRDIRWYAWMPAVTSLIAAPVGMIFYLYPPEHMFGPLHVSFIFSGLLAFFISCWTPATMCLAQNLAPAGSLSVTAATWSTISSFLGFGLGPLLIGDLSDRLAPTHGDQGLTYAMVAISLVPALAAVLYFRLGFLLPPPREPQPTDPQVAAA